MKNILLALLPCFAFAINPENYWQQRVHYKMDIDMDVKTHRLTGIQELTYVNNSPDTIRQVFYHLYFNAFQPESMMDVRSRNLPDPDKRVGSRISKLNAGEIGYQKIRSFRQNGQELAYRVQETILQATLVKPVLPGDSTVLNMDFEAQVPVQIRRSGRNNTEGIDYTMTQWYPKIAEYDEHGWHPDPYVSREFYGVFGTFDVNIKIDSDYKIGGTGALKNPENYWNPGKTKEGATEQNLTDFKGDKRTWSFHAENVHDFAWAADPRFIHRTYPGPDGLELHFFYLKKYRDTWEELPPHTARFFRLMNERYGKYAYPQFSVIQGGDGGMEYPMCTMLKGTGKLKGLTAVMVHEAAHNWFYGMLATNETQSPWMDEGFTSFAEEEVLNAMADSSVQNPHIQAYKNYLYLVDTGLAEPMSTPGDYFSNNLSYGISSYSRGELFLSQLRYIIGKPDFDRGMLMYYNKWRFRHPDDWDFIRVMEDVSGMQLDWYLNFWVYTTKVIDYSVEEVISKDRGLGAVRLKRVGEMPMPVRLTIITQKGDFINYYIPLTSMFGAVTDGSVLLPPDTWSWTSPEYELHLEIPYHEIKQVIIDPLHEMADVNPANNSLKVE